ncbi:hypothetical protein ABTC24_19320, partial [Acinetobacter baumannii]
HLTVKTSSHDNGGYYGECKLYSILYIYHLNTYSYKLIVGLFGELSLVKVSLTTSVFLPTNSKAFEPL